MSMFYMTGLALVEIFESWENGQKPLRILAAGFRDSGRILEVYLEILVKQRTELILMCGGNINALSFNRNK